MVGGLPTSTVNGFALHPTNPKVMYVAMRDGIFRSENAGQSWKPVDGGPKGVVAVAVNPKKPDEMYAVTTDGDVFLSADGGMRWSRLP